MSAIQSSIPQHSNETSILLSEQTDALNHLLVAVGCPARHRAYIDALIGIYHEGRIDGLTAKAFDSLLAIRLLSRDKDDRGFQAAKRRAARMREEFLSWQDQAGYQLIVHHKRHKRPDGRSMPARYEFPILRVLEFCLMSARRSGAFRSSPGKALRKAAGQHAHHLKSAEVKPMPPKPEEQQKPDKARRAQQQLARAVVAAQRAGIDPQSFVSEVAQKSKLPNFGKTCVASKGLSNSGSEKPALRLVEKEDTPAAETSRPSPPATPADWGRGERVKGRELHLMSEDGEILETIHVFEGEESRVIEEFRQIPRRIMGASEENVSTNIEVGTFQITETSTDIPRDVSLQGEPLQDTSIKNTLESQAPDPCTDSPPIGFKNGELVEWFEAEPPELLTERTIFESFKEFSERTKHIFSSEYQQPIWDLVTSWLWLADRGPRLEECRMAYKTIRDEETDSKWQGTD